MGAPSIWTQQAHEALDDPERRRIRGVAVQSVLVAFQLLAANVRKVRQFLVEKTAEPKKIRVLPRRRTTRPLADFFPEATSKEIPSTAGDPDPPSSA